MYIYIYKYILYIYIYIYYIEMYLLYFTLDPLEFQDFVEMRLFLIFDYTSSCYIF